MPRSSSASLVILTAVLVAACDSRVNPSPTGPTALPGSSTTPSPSTAVGSLTIEGPSSLRPRRQPFSNDNRVLVQYRAMYTRPDGATEDVTGRASWRSSNAAALSPPRGGQPGEMENAFGGLGDTVITASFLTLTAEMKTRVIEPSDFVLSGTITAADTGGPLLGAYVQVFVGNTIPPRNGSRVAYTDKAGRFQLFGAFDGADVYVGVAGFERLIARASATEDTVMNFALTPVEPPAAIAGAWNFALSIAPACRPLFPEAVWERRYDVSIAQESAQMLANVTGPSITLMPLGGFGSVTSSRLLFGDGDTAADYWFRDQVTPTGVLQVGPWIDAAVSGNLITGTMPGDQVRWQPAPTSPSVRCNEAHSYVFRRK